MMKPCALILLFLGILWTVHIRAATDDSFDAESGFVFTGDSASSLAVMAGAEVEPLWEPSNIEISELEAELAVTVNEKLGDEWQARRNRPLVRDYFRQYAGITLQGNKLIFINGFHRSHVEWTARWLAEPHTEYELKYLPPEARNEAFWRFMRVVVADGGEYFFQAIYDPKSKRIVGFTFNGHGG